MRIGIFGGSFDPIHNGHLNIARYARQEYRLDEVWLMPSAHSPNKREEDMEPKETRLAMIELAVRDDPFLKTSDFEFKLPGTSYTYRTIEQLHSIHPKDDLFFIMGADSLNYLENWKHPEIICKYAVILAVNRGCYGEDGLLGKIAEINRLFYADIRIVHCDKYNISSHEIRDRIAQGKSCGKLLPEEIAEYIKTNHLYRDS